MREDGGHGSRVCADIGLAGFACELDRGHEGPHKALVGSRLEKKWPR